jgi:peptidoglycan lytic transglycosylase
MVRDRVETSAAGSLPDLSGRQRLGPLAGGWLLAVAAWVSLSTCAPVAPTRVAAATVVTAAAPAATEEDVAVAQQEPPAYSSKARDVWRAAAQGNDWEAVAQKIDALPDLDRADPGTRYVRALAGRRLGDCERALSELDGLAEALPLLEVEIDAIRAECQLSVGPFDATTSDLMNRVSFEGRLEAARNWAKSGERERALALAEGILVEVSEGGDSNASKRDVFVQARSLRAQLAEQLGQRELAVSDLRWLATVAVAADADVAFERLSGTRLTKAERADRAAALAERGLLDLVQHELELVKKAPGTAPAPSTLVRTLAFAHYRSRDDYAQAAQLFEKAARLERGDRASDLFKAASAWSRSKNVKRALAVYDEIIRRYPNSRAAEQAQHSKANTYYASGRWGDAVRAYTQYLDRYGRGKRARRARFVQQSLYERAVAWLARGDTDAARFGFEQLRKTRRSGYAPSMLDHLDAVALASSGVPRQQAEAVERFEQVVRRYPLSFAALLSAARLEQLGRPVPRLDPPPIAQVGGITLPALPPKARLLADLGLNAAAESTLYEEEPALRALYSPRASETLCRQYESLDRGWRQYSLAAGAVEDDVLRRAPTASNLWAWQCLYPRPYAAAVERLEQQYRLPPGLVHSVMRQESEFRPEARSQVGAVGLMQLMPTTAERAAHELALEHESERLTQAEYNLELGAYYLGKLLGSFDARVVLAVASYNAGPHAVSRWIDGGKRMPLDIWAARIPYAETRNYVARVVSNWARYRYLAGGPDNVPKISLQMPSGLQLPSDAY